MENHDDNVGWTYELIAGEVVEMHSANALWR